MASAHTAHGIPADQCGRRHFRGTRGHREVHQTDDSGAVRPDSADHALFGEPSRGLGRYRLSDTSRFFEDHGLRIAFCHGAGVLLALAWSRMHTDIRVVPQVR